jgi:hypothetical protein
VIVVYSRDFINKNGNVRVNTDAFSVMVDASFLLFIYSRHKCIIMPINKSHYTQSEITVPLYFATQSALQKTFQTNTALINETTTSILRYCTMNWF